VNKAYVNKSEYPDSMNFDDLHSWLDKEIEEGDIVEIAGTGEPTLCEWLPDLLRYLDGKKAWVILRTNGFGLGEWRLSLGNALVILAKHDSDDSYVLDRCRYLLPDDIVFEAVTEEEMQAENKKASKLVEFFPQRGHNIMRSFFVTPDGKIRFMSCVDEDMGTVWDYKRGRKWTCMDLAQCPFLQNAYNFIDYLKKPFDLPAGYNHTQVKKLFR